VSEVPELTPCPGELEPREPWVDAVCPHPRPFVCRIQAGSAQASRAVEHVSNIEYLRWLDRAAELHCDTAGYRRADLLGMGVMWFVARHEIDYRAEAIPGDELLLLTWVRDVRRAKSWRDSVIVRPSDRVTITCAATLWVLVDLATRRPISAPDAMSDRLDPLRPRMMERA
jgi:acyl-CoA thioester hydrolase